MPENDQLDWSQTLQPPPTPTLLTLSNSNEKNAAFTERDALVWRIKAPMKEKGDAPASGGDDGDRGGRRMTFSIPSVNSCDSSKQTTCHNSTRTHAGEAVSK